ncbi:MAG: hypothetical protein GXY83_30455 [Rhodopirellula sp.]|nr:hypothetical protein [Rhodopirellula sp.]
MKMIYTGYAVPSEAEPGKFSLVPDLPAEAPAPVFQLIVMGPDGGAVEIPEVPIHFWELCEYQFLPVGYPATVVRVK